MRVDGGVREALDFGADGDDFDTASLIPSEQGRTGRAEVELQGTRETVTAFRTFMAE